jgi:hypothetical protein
VEHITSNLVGYERLMEDVRAVPDTLIRRETEVQTTGGRWYMMRILPYRTVENVIDGDERPGHRSAVPAPGGTGTCRAASRG